MRPRIGPPVDPYPHHIRLKRFRKRIKSALRAGPRGVKCFDYIVMLDRNFISSRLHVETTWEDPLSKMVVYKSIQSDMRSDQSIKMVQGWLRSCITSHKGCLDISTDYLPTRLIDVGPPDGTIQPRVFLPSHSKYAFSNRNLKYIALSYYWGRQDELSENPPIKTTSDTLGDHMNSIPTETLPRTIVDAVILTPFLGFRYLWGDSLCILQGDDKDEAARKDWAQESSTMSSVYGKATLTICAAWGRSVHDGLFTPRKITESYGIRLKLNFGKVPTLSGAIRLRKPPDIQPFKDSLDPPLYQRAWTLQERLLLLRVLICNEDQFAWECQTHNLTESGYKMKGIGAMRLDADFLQRAKGNNDVFRDMWQCIAKDYSARSLTKPSDKLPALAGIARKFHELNGGEYLAGIWKESLLDDLLWAHHSIYNRFTSGVEYRPEFENLPNLNLATPARGKPSRYRAPSWSWTAVDGPVRWSLADIKGEYFTKLLDSKVSHRSRDIFGDVADSYLTLQGPLWKIPSNIAALLLRPEHHNKLFSCGSTPQWVYETCMDLESVESVNKVQVLDPEGFRDLFLLRIKTSGALILELDGSKREVEGQESYKRVGVVAGMFNRSHWDTSLCVETTICRIV